MDIDQVLRDYREGDEDTRLTLFLAYRDLREEFSAIQDLDVAHCSEKDGVYPAGPCALLIRPIKPHKREIIQ